MLKHRFVRVWVVWAVVYAALVAVGPNGLLPVPVWPVVSQHYIQARAWIGDDIELWNDDGTLDSVLEVRPRLDVTPYFRHREVADPRESTLVANLAAAVRDPEKGLIPIQEAWAESSEILMSDDLVCHVGFPPGPSFFLVPLVALFGSLVATQWLSALLGGLAVAAMDRFLAGWMRMMRDDGTLLPADLITVLAGAGTLWLWIVPDGGTFLFAQVVGTTALSLALLASWEKRGWLAGLAFGIAIASRPAMLFAFPLLLVTTILRGENPAARADGDRSTRLPTHFWLNITPLFVGPLIFGGLTLLLNFQRFGAPYDFGYRLMIVPPFLGARLLEYGQFSLAYLARNIQYVGLEPPMVVRNGLGNLVFPFVASDPQGMGFLFVTPAFGVLPLVLWIKGRRRQVLLATTWITLILTCLPGLCYYNTGWVQWGGRLLMDAWPMWLLLVVIGLHRIPPRLAWALIALSIFSNAWGALLVAIRSWPGCCF